VPRTTIVRDLAVLLVTVGFFLEDLRSRGQPGAAAWLFGIGAGVLAAVTGFLVHEWGHLAGALAVGSFVHYPNRLLAPLLFHFDTAKNDRRQFLWMSYGGYAGSLVGLAVIAVAYPLDALSGRVALGLAAVGFVVTAVAEVPTTVRVHRGAPLPTGYAFVPPRP
jgi:hypothetical protein